MSELKPRITENGIDYILVGDYYIPDLKLPEEHRPIGKYGRMHREYLREVHPARLNTLTLTGEVMDISCRPERTGTGTVRHHHGADESCRGRDRGIEAYLVKWNGCSVAITFTTGQKKLFCMR